MFEYPTNRAARAGSCISMHVWRPGANGTNGCVALPEPQLASLHDFADSGAVLAVLPGQALDRFKECLPLTCLCSNCQQVSKIDINSLHIAMYSILCRNLT